MLKSKKTNLNFGTYLTQVNQELKKVTWATREDTLRLTGLVIISSLILGALVGSLDFIFTQLLQFILR